MLALKHRRGEISEELSIALFRFVRDGYIVIEGAVSPEKIDQLNSEIELCWSKPPKGLLIETFEPDNKLKYVPPKPEYRVGKTKMLDLYAFSPVAREAISTPRVVEFLEALFEDKPNAFQALTFCKVLSKRSTKTLHT